MPETALRTRSGLPLVVVGDTDRQIPIVQWPRGRQEGLIAAATLVSVNVGPVDASFEVSANVLVTVSTTHSFGCQLQYTDEGNTVRTMFWDFATPSAYPSGAAAIVNASGAVPYMGYTHYIRAKAGTTITIATVGTFTTVTYNAEAMIKQIG